MRERVVVDHVADHGAVLRRRRSSTSRTPAGTARGRRVVVLARHVEQHDDQRPGAVGLRPPLARPSTPAARTAAAARSATRRALIAPLPRPSVQLRTGAGSRSRARNSGTSIAGSSRSDVGHLGVAARPQVRRAVRRHQPAVVGDRPARRPARGAARRAPRSPEASWCSRAPARSVADAAASRPSARAGASAQVSSARAAIARRVRQVGEHRRARVDQQVDHQEHRRCPRPARARRAR